MTFGPNHYVPVLKVKRGEKSALKLLPSSVAKEVTPLLEIVARTNKEKSIDDHLDTAFKNLADSLQSFSRCFIDARELSPLGPSAAEKVFERAEGEGIVFTPVTGISRTADVDATLDHRGQGIALRITRDEFESGKLKSGLQNFMIRHELKPEDIDLIVDLGAVDEMVAPGVEALTAAFLADVPSHQRWRTFTLSSCAFPPSMGCIDRNSHGFVDRIDWLAWRDGLHSRRDTLARLPSYSDGAIQHPQGVEGFDPRTMQVSASIRYTTPEKWLLIKGESTRRTLASVQFKTLATQLAYSHLKPYFAGSDHCKGCSSMKRAAVDTKGLGSLEVWRRLGTIHHITTVVESLWKLPWS